MIAKWLQEEGVRILAFQTDARERERLVIGGMNEVINQEGLRASKAMEELAIDTHGEENGVATGVGGAYLFIRANQGPWNWIPPVFIQHVVPAF